MEHVLKLTDEQLNAIGAGLSELPFKIAQPVMAAIQQQIEAAGNAAKAAEESRKTDDKKPKLVG